MGNNIPRRDTISHGGIYDVNHEHRAQIYDVIYDVIQTAAEGQRSFSHDGKSFLTVGSDSP